MKKILLFIFLISMVCSTAYSADYYMATDGSDGGTGATDDEWLTLRYSMSQMSAGDTLIIRDGTYTGATNMLDYQYYPPIDNSTWTTIKAENDGDAIFDGESVRTMFDFQPNDATNCHWIFEGLIWKSSTGTSTVLLAKSDYVKYLRCGAYDTDNGAAATFYSGPYNEYILYENCYAYGRGRYQFQSRLSSHIIFRQCVARFDWIDSGNENVALFTAYSSDDVEFQNCIGIDSDQVASWTNYYALSGTFFVPATGTASNRINFTQCIGLNNKLGGISTADGANDVTLQDCILWDVIVKDVSEPINNFRGDATEIYNSTFGVAHDYEYPAFRSYDVDTSNESVVDSSLIYSYRGTDANEVFSDIEYYDYNNYYYNLNGPTPNTNDIAVNPIWHVSSNTDGGLKYITRIESGSTLSGQGDGSTDIGANTLTLIGTSGTLWGEEGYATDTTNDMWPFPYEGLIKENMATYSNGGVTGQRGFCTNTLNERTDTGVVTLTSYVWEYLGNDIPSTIYDLAGEPDTTPPADLSDLSVATGSSTGEIDLSWTAPGDDNVTGTADSYDVRYSTATINDGNWGSATEATGEPSPSIAGSAESMTISSLTPGETYYVGVKTSDEVPNESGLSNIPNAIAAVNPPQFTGVTGTGVTFQ